MSDTSEVTLRLAVISEQLGDAWDERRVANWGEVARLCAGIADAAREAMQAADRVANRRKPDRIANHGMEDEN